MCSPNLLCPLCFQLSFPNIENLRRSLIKVANSPIICPLCNDTFLGLDKFTIHLFSHTDLTIEGQQSVDCNINLKPDKMSLMYGNQQSGLPCTPCDSSVPHNAKTIDKLNPNYFREELALGETIDGGTNTFGNLKIIDLQRVSATNNNQTKHVEPATAPQTTAATLESSGVDDSQTELIASTTRMKLNESAKEWECDICSKSFTTKYFLKKHKRLHTGEMPYACEICGRTFTFQQSYHKHLLYHNDEKPHVCQTCNRSFKELSTLQNHKRIHSGEKPFKCELCGKCFRQRVSFLVHTRIHTGAMPYECTACQKKFRYKFSQRTHKCIPINLPAEESRIPDTSFPSNSATISNLNQQQSEKKVEEENKAFEMLEFCFKETPPAQADNYEYIGMDGQLYGNSNQSLSQNFLNNETVNIVNLIAEQGFTNEASSVDNTLFPQFNIESFIL